MNGNKQGARFEALRLGHDFSRVPMLYRPSNVVVSQGMNNNYMRVLRSDRDVVIRGIQ